MLSSSTTGLRARARDQQAGGVTGRVPMICQASGFILTHTVCLCLCILGRRDAQLNADADAATATDATTAISFATLVAILPNALFALMVAYMASVILIRNHGTPFVWPWDPTAPRRHAGTSCHEHRHGNCYGKDKKLDGRNRFCRICGLFKPDRAHHCRLCGK